MGKFVFRLDPVLQQRIMDEEKAILEQAEARQEHIKQVRLLDEIKSNLEKCMDDMSPGAVSCMDIMNGKMYLDYLNNQLDIRQIEVARAAHELEIKRLAVTEARKNRLVLEKLKENQFKGFMDNLNMAEQRELDEMGTALVARRKG